MVIVMFISSSLGVVDAFLVSMVFFLVGCDCDVHEFFSWCCWCTSCVDGPLLGQSWSWCSWAFLLVLLMHLLCWLSFSWSWSWCSFSLCDSIAFLVLIVLFMVNGDCNVHEFFSWCYSWTSCVDVFFLGQWWSWCSWILLLVLLMHFLCWWSFSWLVMIMMIEGSSLGVVGVVGSLFDVFFTPSQPPMYI